MELNGKLSGVVQYATNDLEIMVPAGNPQHIESLKDLARPDIRLSMPNPQWEGVTNPTAASLRKAGGEKLYQAVYQNKVKNRQTILTEIHQRRTPMRIMSKQVDTGVDLGLRGSLSGEHQKSDSGCRNSGKPECCGDLCWRRNEERSTPHGRCAVAGPF
jgi:hypothetical protein